MNDDLFNPHPLLRSILLIDLDALDPVQRLPALEQTSENRILPIQVRRLVERDEKLAPVRPRPFVRHAQRAARVVPQRRLDLVFEGRAVDTRAVFCAARGWRAGLEHEGRDQAVDRAGVVEARGAEGEEVVGCFGAGRTVELELKGAVGCE